MRFVFVHGPRHGARCWEKVVLRTEACGHDTSTIDLPGFGALLGLRADGSPLDGRPDVTPDGGR